MTKHLLAYDVDQKNLTMVLVLSVVYLMKSLKSSIMNRTIENNFKI